MTAAINAITAGGAAWEDAVVTYDSTTGAFNLVSGVTGADSGVAVLAGVTEDLAAPLGWLSAASGTSPGTIITNGQAAQTIAANLTALTNISNNFGSFCLSQGLSPSLATITAAANWNNSLTPNIQFLFSVQVSVANASAWSAALGEIGGCSARSAVR